MKKSLLAIIVSSAFSVSVMAEVSTPTIPVEDPTKADGHVTEQMAEAAREAAYAELTNDKGEAGDGQALLLAQQASQQEFQESIDNLENFQGRPQNPVEPVKPLPEKPEPPIFTDPVENPDAPVGDLPRNNPIDKPEFPEKPTRPEMPEAPIGKPITGKPPAFTDPVEKPNPIKPPAFTDPVEGPTNPEAPIGDNPGNNPIDKPEFPEEPTRPEMPEAPIGKPIPGKPPAFTDPVEKPNPIKPPAFTDPVEGPTNPETPVGDNPGNNPIDKPERPEKPTRPEMPEAPIGEPITKPGLADGDLTEHLGEGQLVKQEILENATGDKHPLINPGPSNPVEKPTNPDQPVAPPSDTNPEAPTEGDQPTRPTAPDAPSGRPIQVERPNLGVPSNPGTPVPTRPSLNPTGEFKQELTSAIDTIGEDAMDYHNNAMASMHAVTNARPMVRAGQTAVGVGTGFSGDSEAIAVGVAHSFGKSGWSGSATFNATSETSTIDSEVSAGAGVQFAF